VKTLLPAACAALILATNGCSVLPAADAEKKTAASTPVEQRADAKDFFVAVSVVPGTWITSVEEDLKNIAQIADTIFVSCGNTRHFQETQLKPTLDAAQRHGLKAVLLYYRLEQGSTSLEETAKNFGNHAAVVGFKIKDELGDEGESADYWLQYLKEARAVIRKHSHKPIMADIIPWEFWSAGNVTYGKKYPAAKNEAIDSYIEAGVLDWLIVSVGDRIPEMVPKAQARWGNKVKIVVRTSGSFVGDSYENGAFKRNITQTAAEKSREVKRVCARAREAKTASAIGIHYYTWQHADYRILDKNGKSNPLFEAMKKNFSEMKR